MPRLIGEADNFIFNGWTVTRANSLNHTGKHRRAIQILPNNLMGRRVGVSHPTTQLIFEINRIRRCKTKMIRCFIAWLFFGFGKVYRIAVNTRRGSGFEAAQFKAQLLQVFRKLNAWQTVIRAGTIHEFANNNFTAGTGASC